MTDQKDEDPDYKVGYGKPPRDTQFRKGLSGNPRGRRPKIKPSRTNLQLQLDFLTIAEELITVTLNGKQKKISGYQAVILKLQQKALSGDKHAISLYLQMAGGSMSDFSDANPEATGMVVALHRARMMNPDQLDAETIKTVNKLHEQTRS